MPLLGSQQCTSWPLPMCLLCSPEWFSLHCSVWLQVSSDVTKTVSIKSPMPHSMMDRTRIWNSIASIFWDTLAIAIVFIATKPFLALMIVWVTWLFPHIFLSKVMSRYLRYCSLFNSFPWHLCYLYMIVEAAPHVSSISWVYPGYNCMMIDWWSI